MSWNNLGIQDPNLEHPDTICRIFDKYKITTWNAIIECLKKKPKYETVLFWIQAISDKPDDQCWQFMLKCNECQTVYTTRGYDVFGSNGGKGRKCPTCQFGAPGSEINQKSYTESKAPNLDALGEEFQNELLTIHGKVMMTASLGLTKLIDDKIVDPTNDSQIELTVDKLIEAVMRKIDKHK